jgi:hypothetical protein
VSTARKRVPPGIIVERVEMVVDGGRVFDDGGGGEIDLSPSANSLAGSTMTVSRQSFALLPIGARVVLQLERLPDAPKPVSKKRRSR